MNLSIIITTVDDADLINTVESIKATAPEAQLIIVDDASASPPQEMFPGIRGEIIRNRWRCGVGPSRTVGIHAARCDNVFFGDSHLRFLPNWAESTIERLAANPTSVYCFECLGLNRSNMDVLRPVSKYHSASWNFSGKDANGPGAQVFECVWRKDYPKDDEQISALMGGAYACRRDWFLKLEPLRYLRQWGGDEQQLSLKSYLSGGDVRINTAHGIGHRFLETVVRPSGHVVSGGERQPYTVNLGYPTWNKLFSMNTNLPPLIAERLSSRLLDSVEKTERAAAEALLRSDWRLILAERQFNRELFTVKFEAFCERFGLTIPT